MLFDPESEGYEDSVKQVKEGIAREQKTYKNWTPDISEYYSILNHTLHEIFSIKNILDYKNYY